jgi:redox-sensitive bicupin YhaK (pirin superfamily)
VINAGEVQWMTAGSGIIHGENVVTKGQARLSPAPRVWASMS